MKGQNWKILHETGPMWGSFWVWARRMRVMPPLIGSCLLAEPMPRMIHVHEWWGVLTYKTCFASIGFPVKKISMSLLWESLYLESGFEHCTLIAFFSLPYRHITPMPHHSNVLTFTKKSRMHVNRIVLGQLACVSAKLWLWEMLLWAKVVLSTGMELMMMMMMCNRDDDRNYISNNDSVM